MQFCTQPDSILARIRYKFVFGVVAKAAAAVAGGDCDGDIVLLLESEVQLHPALCIFPPSYRQVLT